MPLLTIFAPNPALQVDSIVVGEIDTTTLVVTFKYDVVSTDFTAGVTIEINDVAATIVSATRQTNHKVVHYVIDTAIDGNDVVDFLYDDDSGLISKEDPALTFSVTGISNRIGGQTQFDRAENSGLYPVIL